MFRLMQGPSRLLSFQVREVMVKVTKFTTPTRDVQQPVASFVEPEPGQSRRVSRVAVKK